MFLGFYQCKTTGVGAAAIHCLLGRGGLTNANHGVTIKKQLLVPGVGNDFVAEGARLLAMAQAQDMFTLTNAIDPDIAVMSSSQITQLHAYVLANPTKKASIKLSLEQYKADHMFYLDWEDRWVSIKDGTSELIGLYYMKYVVNIGGVKSVNDGSFELQAV